MTMQEQIDTPAVAVPSWSEVAEASQEAQTPARQTFRRLVKVALSDHAVAALADDLAKELLRIERQKEALKDSVKEAKEEIRDTETRAKGLREAITSREGVEELECYERFDPDTGRTELVALDGRVLEAADVPAEKRQLSLDDAVKANGRDEDGDEGESDEDPDSFDAAEFADRSEADLSCDAEPADAPLDSSAPEITDPDTVLAGAAEEESPRKTGRRR